MRRARRGTVYLIVLVSVMIVVIIGLGGLFAARVQGRQVSAGGAFEQSFLNAHAAIELGAKLINEDPNWRTTYGDGEWIPTRNVRRGSLALTVRDPTDDSVADSNLDPIVMRGVGRMAGSRQMLEVRLVPVPSGLDSLDSAAHAGRIMAFDGSTVQATAPMTSNDSAWASGAVVNGDVESAGSIIGSTYNGAVTQDGSARAMPAASDVVATYQSGATPITMGEIKALSDNLLLNGSFEGELYAWAGNNAVLTRATTSPAEGAYYVEVTGRTQDTSGPIQDITDVVVDGLDYTVTLWARSSGTNVDVQMSVLVTDGISTIFKNGPRVRLGASWTKLQGTIRKEWDLTKGERGYLAINTKTGTDNFDLDGVSLTAPVAGPAEIRHVVLSPSHNPYGAQIVNPDGMYSIDCAGADLDIRDCRIHGTLVVLNPGPNSRVEGSVAWSVPSVVPALIVDGDMTIETTDAVLDEAALLVNFNHAGTGIADEDSDIVDSYASLLDGLVYVSNDVILANRSVIDGLIISGRDMIFRADQVVLNHDPAYSATPPTAFMGAARMAIDRRSWKKAVD